MCLLSVVRLLMDFNSLRLDLLFLSRGTWTPEPDGEMVLFYLRKYQGALYFLTLIHRCGKVCNVEIMSSCLNH